MASSALHPLLHYYYLHSGIRFLDPKAVVATTAAPTRPSFTHMMPIRPAPAQSMKAITPLRYSSHTSQVHLSGTALTPLRYSSQVDLTPLRYSSHTSQVALTSLRYSSHTAQVRYSSHISQVQLSHLSGTAVTQSSSHDTLCYTGTLYPYTYHTSQVQLSHSLPVMILCVILCTTISHFSGTVTAFTVYVYCKLTALISLLVQSSERFGRPGQPAVSQHAGCEQSHHHHHSLHPAPATAHHHHHYTDTQTHQAGCYINNRRHQTLVTFPPYRYRQLIFVRFFLDK